MTHNMNHNIRLSRVCVYEIALLNSLKFKHHQMMIIGVQCDRKCLKNDLIMCE